MELTIESIRPGDGARYQALLRQAFGGTSVHDPDGPEIDPDQAVCAYDGDRMVGGVLTFDFAMTWGGRRVACGGVSGVVVAPEARGRGAARRMLDESFDRMDRRGQVVSALYPTTASLYRDAGFEIVGWYQRRRVPVGAVRVGDGAPLDWRAVEVDEPRIRALHDDMAGRHDGWFRVDPGWWTFRAHRQRGDASTNRFTYVGSRDRRDVVVVQYRYEPTDTFYDLEVEVLAGVDNHAIGGALALLAGHGTTAGHLVTTVPASVLGRHVPHLQRTTAASEWPWMLRLVDAPGAVAARGWPRSVSGTVALDIVDPVRPANAGAHVLEVGDGQGALLPGGEGRVTVSIQDLAMLYSGCDVAGLRAAGRLVEATADDLDLLAAACVSNPSIPLFF